MSKSIYIHAGLIKTGSSFLQDTFFSQINSDLEYIGSVGRLNSRDSFQKKHSRVLISNENLLGHPLLEEKYQKNFLNQFKTAVEKGESVFQQPKWIIGFREPSSFIKSVYKQHLHEWGTLSWSTFKEQYKDLMNDGLKFSEYVHFLVDRIPANRLFLYEFDELKQDPANLLESILLYMSFGNDQTLKDLSQTAINQKSNVGVKDNMIPLLLRLNRISNWSKKNLGFRLALSLGTVKLNPTILVRDHWRYFDSFSQSKAFPEYDIIDLKNRYRKDWLTCKNLIYESRK